MEKKLKYAISALGVVIILAVGIVAFNTGKDIPEIANNKTATETKIITTSPIIGNIAIDESINEALNEVLSESDFDSELADIELALDDEEILDEINNLINDDEL